MLQGAITISKSQALSNRNPLGCTARKEGIANVKMGNSLCPRLGRWAGTAEGSCPRHSQPLCQPLRHVRHPHHLQH